MVSAVCWTNHISNCESRDGLHAVQRARQRKAHPRTILAPWGEKVRYMHAIKKKVQFTDTLSDGIFLGIKDGSEEVIIGTPSGCKECRTFNRRPREDAADPVLFNSIRGIRVNVVRDDDFIREPREPKLGIDVRPVNTFLFRSALNRRNRTRISVELARYGYALGCPGCEAAVNAISGSSRDHSEQCRTRVVKAMRDDVALSECVRGAYARMSRNPSEGEPDLKNVRYAGLTTKHVHLEFPHLLHCHHHIQNRPFRSILFHIEGQVPLADNNMDLYQHAST